jgi:hypothetical protein
LSARIRRSVFRDDADDVLPIGEREAVERDEIVGDIFLQQLKARIGDFLEIDVVNELIAIAIFGGPLERPSSALEGPPRRLRCDDDAEVLG